MMRIVVVVVCLLGALLSAGCETLGYYKQGVQGQLAFYGAREPIADVLQKRQDLASDVRRRLELVPQITAFAKEQLKLPVKGQYRDYVQLQQPVVGWNVFAAQELSFDPYRWCYLFHAICVEYRGYFREADAKTYAAKLRAKEYDANIGGIAAFSTLGWLDDPVTSVLTAYPDDLLASVLFHELAHSVVYVKDDTVFNESFASAVGDEGLSRWLAAHGEPAHSQTMDRIRDQQKLLDDVALEIRGELAALYTSSASAADKRARKQQLLAGAVERYRTRCAERHLAACPNADWFAVKEDGSGLNNAKLNMVATYEHDVPAFAALIRAHNGDMAAFYDTVKALGKMPKKQRGIILEALLAQAPAQPVVAGSSTP